MTTDHDLGVRILSGAPYKKCNYNMNFQLKKNKSNFVPLTPLSFLYRTKNIFPKRTAWIYGKRKATSTQGVDNLDRKAGKASESIDGLGKSSDETTTGQRDMLGTIFGVQMGLSLLTGATSDAGTACPERGSGRSISSSPRAISSPTRRSRSSSRHASHWD